MRRAQVSVLLLGLALPLLALALAALALLGAQVQGLRAQRLAEAAALRAARTQPGRDVAMTVALPTVRLRLPLLGPVAYAAHGRAIARGVVSEDGRRGAVLVG